MQRIDDAMLDGIFGGFAWEQFRQSTNVEDHRGRYSASEDGTLYDNWTGRSMQDPTANQELGGWRDDPDTGQRTWIDGDGENITRENPNGTFEPAPSIWDEQARNSPTGEPQQNDFNWGDVPSNPNPSQSGGDDLGAGPASAGGDNGNGGWEGGDWGGGDGGGGYGGAGDGGYGGSDGGDGGGSYE